MNDTERRVAVLDRIHNDTDREQIINLIQGLALIYHLTVNTEEMFDAAVDFSVDAGFFDMLSDFLRDLLYVLFPFEFSLVDLADKLLIDIRL